MNGKLIVLNQGKTVVQVAADGLCCAGKPVSTK